MADRAPSRRAALLQQLTITVTIAIVIVTSLALVLLLSGFDVASAFGALVRGAVGSPYAIFSATLVRATPLMLTGLAVAVAFQGGILNIGAEGQLLAGAAAATALALGVPSLGISSLVVASIPIGLLSAALAGGAWASIPMWLRAKFGVLEVITTIMMNFIAIYLVGWMVRGPLQEPTHIYPQSAAISESSHLTLLLSGYRLHAGFLLAVLLCVVAWYIVRYTAAGFRLRVVGANPAAATTAAQIDVARVSGRAFLLSGALAGLAGGVEVYGVTYALYENLSPGYGYTAIAVALLAGLNPLAVVVSAIFLGALAAGAAAMQREAGVPSVMVSVVEALIILALVGGRAYFVRRQLQSSEVGV